ncbi:MAG: hypothetical protein ACXWKP_33150 [Bradyrhizobium sp.]
MRNIILAVTITVVASAILITLTMVLGTELERLLGISTDVVAKGATAAASAPFFVYQNVYELVEASSAKRALAKASLSSTISISEFSIHPLPAFLFSLIAWSGVFYFTGALMGLFVIIADDGKINIIDTHPQVFLVLIALTALPLRIIAAAYMGRFIGARSHRYVLGIVIGSIALGCIANFLMSVLTVSNDQLKAMLDGRTALEQFNSFLPDMVTFMISGGLGFWYGQRHKPADYLTFVMKILPPGTRQTIVEMAEEEALRARRHSS